MRKNLYLINLMWVTLLCSSVTFGQERDSISMGPGYADDVFYSFNTGEVSRASRATWDIAFYTPRFSAGIMINEGSGVKLYSYPNGDTTDWNNLDTTGMSTWKTMNNMPEYWEEGAFTNYSSGHPDYGWGIYNMVDHSVYGDSIFVINSLNGLKKLKIVKKVSIENIYHLVYANLDGSDEKMVELDIKPFEEKMFAYYNMSTEELIDREPAADAWDILFTKYMDWTTDLSGNESLYLVTGVTTNLNIGSNNFYPVTEDFSDWGSVPFDTLKNSIGYDWKSFDMSLFEWTIKDSNYYFVGATGGDIYKLKFVSWAGSGFGDCSFEKTLMSLASVGEEISEKDGFDLFPNPATDMITIRSQENLNGELLLSVVDQTGRQLYHETIVSSELAAGFKLTNMDLSRGLYLVTISGTNYSHSQKLIVR